jgi:hypothetical protein
LNSFQITGKGGVDRNGGAVDEHAAKILEYARMCRCAYLRILDSPKYSE